MDSQTQLKSNKHSAQLLVGSERAKQPPPTQGKIYGWVFFEVAPFVCLSSGNTHFGGPPTDGHPHIISPNPQRPWYLPAPFGGSDVFHGPFGFQENWSCSVCCIFFALMILRGRGQLIRLLAIHVSRNLRGMCHASHTVDDEILHHLRDTKKMIPLSIPTNNGFPWFQSGAKWILQPSTVCIPKLGHSPWLEGGLPK